jgi:hypothetical protein
MAKTWVLDTETKGTGANMVPLERVQKKPERDGDPPRKRAAKHTAKPAGRQTKRRAEKRETSSTALPAGHVRKKATGEIGKVQAVDAKAGTATVRWLKRGAASTVRLSEISRH